MAYFYNHPFSWTVRYFCVVNAEKTEGMLFLIHGTAWCIDFLFCAIPFGAWSQLSHTRKNAKHIGAKHKKEKKMGSPL